MKMKVTGLPESMSVLVSGKYHKDGAEVDVDSGAMPPPEVLKYLVPLDEAPTNEAAAEAEPEKE